MMISNTLKTRLNGRFDDFDWTFQNLRHSREGPRRGFTSKDPLGGAFRQAFLSLKLNEGSKFFANSRFDIFAMERLHDELPMVNQKSTKEDMSTLVDLQADLDARVGFSTRLKSCLDNKSLKQVDLARVAGESTSVISNYVRGEKWPSAHSLINISRVLGVRPEWLLQGAGDQFEHSPEAQGDHTLPIIDVAKALDTDLWNDLRVFDGNLLLDDQMLFHLGRQDTRGLVSIVHEGDANVPLIADGAFVVVDTFDTRLREGVFAYRVGDQMMIRRLRRTGYGEIAALAENPRYPPDIFAGETRSHLAIIGRVLGSVSRL